MVSDEQVHEVSMGEESRSEVEGSFGYRDFANVDEPKFDSNLESQNGKKNDHRFPARLHYLLSERDEHGMNRFVSWLPHGRGFIVHNKERFEKEVLPLWFSQTKMESFQKQLNLYGFKRINHGPDKGCYYHEMFLRGKLFLAERINCVRIKGQRASRRRSSLDSEPNFYSMPISDGTVDKDTDAASSSSPKQHLKKQLHSGQEGPARNTSQASSSSPKQHLQQQLPRGQAGPARNSSQASIQPIGRVRSLKQDFSFTERVAAEASNPRILEAIVLQESANPRIGIDGVWSMLSHPNRPVLRGTEILSAPVVAVQEQHTRIPQVQILGTREMAKAADWLVQPHGARFAAMASNHHAGLGNVSAMTPSELYGAAASGRFGSSNDVGVWSQRSRVPYYHYNLPRPQASAVPMEPRGIFHPNRPLMPLRPTNVVSTTGTSNVVRPACFMHY